MAMSENQLAKYSQIMDEALKQMAKAVELEASGKYEYANERYANAMLTYKRAYDLACMYSDKRQNDAYKKYEECFDKCEEMTIKVLEQKDLERDI